MTELQQVLEVAPNPEENVNLPWDPLREQDWTSLGVEPSDDVSWGMICDGGMSATCGDILNDDDHHNGSRLQPKVCLQFSPVAVDTVADCFWDNLGFTLPSGNAKHFAGPQDESSSRLAGLKPSLYASTLQSSLSKPAQPSSHDSDMSAASTSYSGSTPPDSFDFQDSGSILPAIPDSDSALLNNHDIVLGDMCSQAPPDSSLFPVQLFVTAIADGKILPDCSAKMRGVLEQVRKKVSKEQNTVVQIKNEGSVDLKMRVFVANSLEAGAVAEYIASHPDQIPAPFVVLSKQLHMAVSYDSATINPSIASVADRLRKQIKTHAVKVLRESISDPLSSVTTAMLRGNRGPSAPAEHIMPIVLNRAVAVSIDAEHKYVVLPAKNRPVREPSSASSPAASPKPSPRGLTAPLTLTLPTTTVSPAASSPSTPHARDEEEAAEHKLSAHFPVNLFVTAIADGTISPETPHKVQERLAQIVRKVPKEQNTSVEVLEGNTIDLKMRVFVVNSEDAKAVGDYINAHLDQLPAPFVVLARHLPMAVLYDPQTLDLADASVADRLRKQAKTRAVKVLREAIGNKALGVTMPMLRGHEGALAPADHLQAALAALTQPIAHCKDDSAGRFVVFAARNKACSAPGSPRKRPASDMAGGADMQHAPGSPREGPASPRMRAGGAGNRRTGAASASHLHRDMLDKVLNKKAKKDEGAGVWAGGKEEAQAGLGMGLGLVDPL